MAASLGRALDTDLRSPGRQLQRQDPPAVAAVAQSILASLINLSLTDPVCRENDLALVIYYRPMVLVDLLWERMASVLTSAVPSAA